jgi:hypothetical protein
MLTGFVSGLQHGVTNHSATQPAVNRNGDGSKGDIKMSQAPTKRREYLKTLAVCKHFAAYSLEEADGQMRFWFDAIVSKQDMVCESCSI